MEISSSASSLAAEKEIPTANPSLGVTQHSIAADRNQFDAEADIQAKLIKKVDKGKGGRRKKHGVMSLPAEIRETYAFQSPPSIPVISD